TWPPAPTADASSSWSREGRAGGDARFAPSGQSFQTAKSPWRRTRLLPPTLRAKHACLRRGGGSGRQGLFRLGPFRRTTERQTTLRALHLAGLHALRAHVRLADAAVFVLDGDPLDVGTEPAV